MPTLIEELETGTGYLTTSQVMRLLSKRRNTICDWVRTGRLPALRLGNSYRFDPRLIAQVLTDQSIIPQQFGGGR